MIHVLHITENPIAGAPMNLSRALNKYQSDKVKSRHIAASDRNENRVFDSDLLLDVHSADEIEQAVLQADVVHFHNFYSKQYLFRKYPYLWPEVKKKPRVWQAHSQRSIEWMDITEGLRDQRAKHLVIGQYHPREWPECEVVPNIVDIWDEKLMPTKRDNDLMRVAFSPSRIGLKGWDNKGYEVTKPVLQRLVDEGLIEAEIIYDYPYEKCLKHRRVADVVIDECVTGSYHLTSLEALSQGQCTVAGLDNIQLETLATLTGTKSHPWFVARADTLYDRLKMLAEHTPTVKMYGLQARAWMEKYWNPKDLTARFVKIYEEM